MCAYTCTWKYERIIIISLHLINHEFRYTIQDFIKYGNILVLKRVFSFGEDKKKRHSADLILGCESYFL